MPRAPDNAGLPPEKRVVAGKITTVHGVRGWVKIHSYTVPEENIFTYQPWWMKFPSGWKMLEIDEFRGVDKGFIAHVRGLDSRDEARLYCQREIEVSPDSFPPSEEDEVYWHQLLGCRVVSRFGGQETLLGAVDGFIETGANDVLVVTPIADSIDSCERLIPYVATCVVEVDMAARTLFVDWDPQFDNGAD